MCKINRGSGDVSCISAALKITPMLWCGRRLAHQRRMGYLRNRKKKRKLTKYGHWKRRSEGLVMDVTDGEIEGSWLPGSQKWIDDARRLTDEDRKTKTRNIVVRCLYGHIQ